MASRRSPIGELVTLAAANDLNGAGTTMDVTGAAAVIIVAQNSGTDGTAGQDVIEFSRDGGTNWETAVAANIGQGHAGLLLEDGSAAAAAGAALNQTAGTEVDAVFSLGPVDGPFMIRCGRGGSGEAGTAWVTGAPAVVALKIG